MALQHKFYSVANCKQNYFRPIHNFTYVFINSIMQYLRRKRLVAEMERNYTPKTSFVIIFNWMYRPNKTKISITLYSRPAICYSFTVSS